jgi:homocitrate synthase NifV
MANANTLCALQAGSNCASVTINGLGERAGNAALEEVVMALKCSLGVPMQYDTSKFHELSQFVAKASGREIHAMKPVTGDMAHKHESGIHTNSIIKNSQTYELFSAKEIGKIGSEFVFGTHSGRYAIINFFRNKKMELTSNDATLLQNRVKQESSKLKRSLTEVELEALYFSIENMGAEMRQKSTLLTFGSNY